MNASSAISPLTRQLANAIGECCGAKKVQPYDLQPAAFFRWLKEERDLSADELRKVREHLSRVGGYQQLRNAFFVGSSTPSTIEKEEMKGIAKLGKENVVALAHDEIFISRFREVMDGVVKDSRKLLSPYGYSTKQTKEKTERAVVLALSDLHFGSKLDAREFGDDYKYDFPEEARSLASVIRRTCEFKRDHRDETELVIWLGGDLIRGKLHDRELGRMLAEQSADAMWLLSQAIRVAAGNFKKVRVFCSSGNHDRDTERHPHQAQEEKVDSRGTVIYFGVKLAVAHLPNVTVTIPRTPQADIEVLGHRIYATHGDTNFRVGNPAKVIDIKSMDQQAQSINLKEFTDGRSPYKVFMTGHVHQGLHIPLPTADLVINPTLMPTEGFAKSIGYLLQRPGQVMFEVTRAYPVGDLRFFFVDSDTVKDAALDKVIAPFKDF
jgi:predicted phosphodiesterase